jgi:hypothetical protein
MTVSRYFALAMMQSAGWLRECIANPSPRMRPIHIAIIRVALRRKAGS